MSISLTIAPIADSADHFTNRSLLDIDTEQTSIYLNGHYHKSAIHRRNILEVGCRLVGSYVLQYILLYTQFNGLLHWNCNGVLHKSCNGLLCSLLNGLLHTHCNGLLQTHFIYMIEWDIYINSSRRNCNCPNTLKALWTGRSVNNNIARSASRES